MVSRETKITLTFVVLGVLSWLVTREIAGGDLWPLIVLITVGVLVPQLINGQLNGEERTEDG